MRSFTQSTRKHRPQATVCADKASWLQSIRAAVSNHAAQRPVVVVFETMKELRQYRMELVVSATEAERKDYATTVVLDDHARAHNEGMMWGAAATKHSGCACLATRQFVLSNYTTSVSASFNANTTDVHVLITFVARCKLDEVRMLHWGSVGTHGSSSELVVCALDLQAIGLCGSGNTDTLGRDSRGTYQTIDEQRNKLWNALVEQRTTRWQREHDDFAELLKNLRAPTTARDSAGTGTGTLKGNLRDMLLLWNRCCPLSVLSPGNLHVADSPAVVETSSVHRSVVLLDATCSMSQVLEAMKEALPMVFESLALALVGEGEPQCPDKLEFELGCYRNYNCPTRAHAFCASGFAAEADPLHQFLLPVSARGGWGREAIELGFAHVLHVHEQSAVDHIIVVGDAPPNSRNDTNLKRDAGGCEWGPAVYFDDVHQQVMDAGIMVSTIFTPSCAHSDVVDADWESEFSQMVANGGLHCRIDVNKDSFDASPVVRPSGVSRRLADKLVATTMRCVHAVAHGNAASSPLLRLGFRST